MIGFECEPAPAAQSWHARAVNTGLLGMIGALAMAVASCGGGQASGATTPASPAAEPAPVSNAAPVSPTMEAELTPSRDNPLAMMTEFADDMCACHDRACADQVNDRMMKWGQEMARNAGSRAASVNGEEAKQIATISERFSVCLTAVFTTPNAQGATPTPTP